MNKKIAIITGSNTGIGYETAIGLVKSNYLVVMACRNQTKADNAKKHILEKIHDAKLEIMHLDLNELASIHKFAQEFKSKFNQLNLLINNAGIFTKKKEITKDGLESQFAINYLGHFLLSALLIDLMPNNSTSRIISLGSIAHKRGNLDFEDINYHKRPIKNSAYPQSKLACLIFALELQRRLTSHNKKILSICAHPGISKTNLLNGLLKRLPYPFYHLIMKLILPLIAHSNENGAKPTLYAALSTNVKGGDYFGPQGFKEMKGKVGNAKKSLIAQDKNEAQKLWQISEKLTSFEFKL